MLDNNDSVARIRNFMYYCAVNETDTEELYIQTIKLGDIAIYALPGEMYVAYGLEIKKNSPTDKDIIIEMCNSYCGYIPTKKAFDECSMLYETSLAFHSCMAPETGEFVVAKALEQANKLFNE